jgi:hypothetical protein
MPRIVILLLLAVPLAACSPSRETRTLETSLPPGNATTLMTHANIGSVVVTASSDSTVHASVKLLPSNNFFWDLFTQNKAPKAIREARLTHTLDSGVLDFSVQYPPDSDSNAINEEWTIAVPANVRVKSHVNIGKLSVTGIGGGVDAQMNIGKVILNVPQGPLGVTVNVGKIEAQSGTAKYGTIELSTNVGEAHLTLDGAKVGNQSKQGAGNAIDYQGKGSDAIRLKVNTGKVTLALSSQAVPAGKP